MNIKSTEIKNINGILQQHLSDRNDICKVVDALYAIRRMIEKRLGVKQNRKKRRKMSKNDENRRTRKMKKQLKEARQMVAWISNEIHRRKVRRKATKREKTILED